MTTIPVREEARRLLDSLGSCNCSECTETAAQALLAAEKRGREEERERCAKFCEEHEVGTSTREGQVVTRAPHNRLYLHAGDAYAAAIRSTN